MILFILIIKSDSIVARFSVLIQGQCNKYTKKILQNETA